MLPTEAVVAPATIEGPAGTPWSAAARLSRVAPTERANPSFDAVSPVLVERGDSFSPVYLDGPPYYAGSITRAELTPEEWQAPRRISMTLPLRNFEELAARVQRGEVLSVQELEQRYLPRAETWRRVAGWLEAEGLEVGAIDDIRLTVVGTGSLAQVATALRTDFARVLGPDGNEYTSAFLAPAVPRAVSDAIANIAGLQPHLRPLPSQLAAVRQTDDKVILPGTYADFYNSTGLGLDGRGQTIVIVGGSRVNPDDLTAFWQKSGLPTTLAQFTAVDLLGPGAQLGDNIHAGEETMDIEWASAMAPGADIVYLSTLDAPTFTSWILAQIKNGRRIGQLSLSFGIPEVLAANTTYENAGNRAYALLSAAGVSCFISSGNYGSTTLIAGSAVVAGGYRSGGTLSVESPSSSPFVTAVGGTVVSFARSGDGRPEFPAKEGAWVLPLPIENLPTLDGSPASTGGLSQIHAKPIWQTGAGLPTENKRAVPDVAAVASANFSNYFHFRGVTWSAAGTSLATPIWAGFAALINQARGQEGRAPIGLLGPWIYPLNGSDSFNAMLQGGNPYLTFSTEATNGAYKVGPNYTMITGLGSPNVAKLVAALKSVETAAPEVPGGAPPAPAPDPIPTPPVTAPPPATPAPAAPAKSGGGGGGMPSLWFLAILCALALVRKTSASISET